MTTPDFQLMWGPAVIGLAIGGALYGTGVGQFIVYVRAFPFDKVQLKFLVSFVFALDTIQTTSFLWTYYYLLVECRMNHSPECAFYLPSFFIVGCFLVYLITFVVQSFYVHRIWIISGRNPFVTAAVLVPALAELILGLCVIAELFLVPTFQLLFTIKTQPLAAAASATCDVIITGSVVYYLRPARTGAIRRGNYIKKLNTVFIQMGVLSFINAFVLAASYYVQVGVAQFLAATPGIVLSKTYVNSMLSVLNARKSIREEQEAQAQRTIEMPTIPTILVSQPRL